MNINKKVDYICNLTKYISLLAYSSLFNNQNFSIYNLDNYEVIESK